MPRRISSALNISQRRNLSGNLKRHINENLLQVRSNEASVEIGRHDKIAQRSAPKGLLLKQRKLFIASKTNNFPMILSSGFNYFESDVNIKDEKGNSPLFYAAKNGDKQMSEFLVRHKAYVNDRCSGGNTPLHMAFASGQIMVSKNYSNLPSNIFIKVVINLISNGGNLNILNDNGQTPVAFGNERLLALLNLNNATATYANYTHSKVLPKEMDNNRFLVRLHTKGDKDNDHLAFDYEALEQPLGQVMPENKEHRRVESFKMKKRASIENNLGM